MSPEIEQVPVPVTLQVTDGLGVPVTTNGGKLMLLPKATATVVLDAGHVIVGATGTGFTVTVAVPEPDADPSVAVAVKVTDVGEGTDRGAV